MTQLTKDKIKRVSALLQSMPGDMADRLCSAARQGDPVLGRLMDYCRAGPEESARRRFFEPLEAVSGDPETARPSRAYAPETLQRAVWSWLSTIAPEVMDPAHAAAQAFGADQPGRLDPERVKAAAAIYAALKAAEQDPKAAKKLRARLGVTDFEPVRHLAGLLRTAPATRAALDGVPVFIGEFTEDLSGLVRDRYETSADADPDAAVWFLFLVMARMDRPWRLLRVFERIARREDDLLVSRTDMAAIGDALLRDAEHHASGFATPPATLAEADAAVRALADFAAVTVGMTREIGIRKDGAWGKRMLELRQLASTNMERIHEAAREAFRRVTPEEGGLRVRITTPARPGEEGYERARALGRFLSKTRDDAGRAAVGNAHQGVIDEIRTRLETLADRLLISVRNSSPEESAAAAERLEDVAGLMASVGAEASSEVFLRRLAAACAA